MEFKESLNKISNVVNSCNTKEQLEVALVWCKLFIKSNEYYEKELLFWYLSKVIDNKIKSMN
jgi:hypothetical protein